MLCFNQCSGQTRVWWTRVCVQPESIAHRPVPPWHLTGTLNVSTRLGESVGALFPPPSVGTPGACVPVICTTSIAVPIFVGLPVSKV